MKLLRPRPRPRPALAVAALLATAVLATSCATDEPALADEPSTEPPPVEQVNQVDYVKTAAQVRKLYEEGPESGYEYRLEPRHHADPNSPDQFRRIACATPAGTFSYEVHRASTSQAAPQWQYLGAICLTSPDDVIQ